MAEADSVSNGYSDVSDFSEVAETSEDVVEEDDKELQEATGRLHSALTLIPDVDISPTSNTPDTDSVSTGVASSSSSLQDDRGSDQELDNEAQAPPLNGNEHKASKPSSVASSTSSSAKTSKTTKTSSKKSKNPLKLLKKLTKWDKPAKKADKYSQFEQVRIDKLPQVFVAKYLGCREVSGFCGLHHVRQPVDQLVAQVQSSLEKADSVELPLVYVVVSPRGLDVREHKLNKQKSSPLPLGLVPIDFISYGVQDIKYWRVFTFIVVKEMSSRSKVTECHAYLCDSSLNARKMALSLGASFRIRARALKQEGKDHNFQVELRPPDQLANTLADIDCDV